VRNVQYSAEVGLAKRGGQGNLRGEKGKEEKTRSKKAIVKVSVMADEEVDTGCRRQHTISASTTRKTTKKE
jgi:hypothetical protein